jgi:hypothetical protein
MSKTAKIGCQKKIVIFSFAAQIAVWGIMRFLTQKGDSTGCYRLLYVMQQLNFAGCKTSCNH